MTKETSRLREFVPVPEFLKKPPTVDEALAKLLASTQAMNDHLAAMESRLLGELRRLHDADIPETDHE